MFDGSSQSLPSVAFWTAWAHSGRSRKRPGVAFYYVRWVLAVITVGGVLDRVGAQREEQEAAHRPPLNASRRRGRGRDSLTASRRPPQPTVGGVCAARFA